MDTSIQIISCNFRKYIIGFLFIKHKVLFFVPLSFFPFVHNSKWSDDTVYEKFIFDKHKIEKN